MVNHLRGQLEITLGEEVYKCKLNFDSLVRIETALSIPILRLANKIGEGNILASELSYILYTAIKGGGRDRTEKNVNDIIWKAGFVDAIKACGEIVANALSSGEDEKKL